eukprot:CAMPEP_0168406144 /NCGR_PEP_ID=MMETSP0228-20121227/25503_1 /TAXON_ID=133427 /ORGANISM="Protoceratium reticulatum, Strain CCCM 535 (=CCMP 1889)" /LENGTH=1111 /DNA_ID=CAMNT_0008419789 /DNA_START=75 /DNA_END=3410 /DNA_ORIENTATION=-
MAAVKLQISIVSAKGLYNADGFLAGKSDPYVICEVPGQPEMKIKTPIIDNCLDPVWDFTDYMDGFMDGDVLEFQVWDSDTFPKPDQLLGKAALAGADFLAQGGCEGELTLEDSKTDASLFIRIHVLETVQGGLAEGYSNEEAQGMAMQGEGEGYVQEEYAAEGEAYAGEAAQAQEGGSVEAMAQSRPQTLHINIMRACGLPNMDGILAGKSDPYCMCLVPGKHKLKKFQTKTINNNLDPVWNHTGKIEGFEAGDSLEFQVWDQDSFPKPDQLLGKVTLSPQDFANNPAGIQGLLQLTGSSGGECGELEVKIQVDGGSSVTASAGGAQAVQPGLSSQVRPGRPSLGHAEALAGARMVRLKVTVFSANGLYNADGFLAGKSDPYCLCIIREKPKQKFKTKTVNNCLDPVWNHLSTFTGFIVGDSLEFQLWDSDTFPKPDQLLGKAALATADFFPAGFQGELLLSESKAAEATVHVRVEVLPDSTTGLSGAVNTSTTTPLVAPVISGASAAGAGGYASGQGYTISGGQPMTISSGQYVSGQAYTVVSTNWQKPVPVQLQMVSQVASAAFDQMDRNHDGVISRTEFAQALDVTSQTVAPVPTKVEYAAPAATYAVPGQAVRTTYAASAGTYGTYSAASTGPIPTYSSAATGPIATISSASAAASSGKVRLRITVFGAKGLYNADGFLAGKSDPYCICLVPEKPKLKFKTKIVNNCLEPTWNHLSSFGGFTVGDSVEFQIWDSDTFPKPDQLLGKVVLTSGEFMSGFQGELVLKESKAPNATVSVRIEVQADTAATTMSGTATGGALTGQATAVEPVATQTYATQQYAQYATSAPVYQAPTTTIMQAPAAATYTQTPAATATYAQAPVTTAVTTAAEPVAAATPAYTRMAAPAPVTYAAEPVATAAPPNVTYAAAPATYTVASPTYAMPSAATVVSQELSGNYKVASTSLSAAASVSATGASTAVQAPVTYTAPAAAAAAASSTLLRPAPQVTTTSPVTTYSMPTTTYAAAPAEPVAATYRVPSSSYQIPAGAARMAATAAATPAASSYKVPAASALSSGVTYAQQSRPVTYAAAPAMTYSTAVPTIASGPSSFFDRADTNHDGVLSRTEFAKALR